MKIVKFSSPESAECTALYEDNLPVEPEPLPQLDPPGKMLRNISKKIYSYSYKSNGERSGFCHFLTGWPLRMWPTDFEKFCLISIVEIFFPDLTYSRKLTLD